MVDVGAVMVYIRANLSQFSRDLRQALRDLQDATDRMGDDVDDLADRTEQATSRMQRYFKDVSRIVSGIVISQAFYNALNTIEQASKAVFDFSMTLEDAQTKFEMLLGSEEEARKYMLAVQEFAAKTPFDFEGVTEAAEQIKLMGVETKAVLPILRTVGDAVAAMGGGTDKLRDVVRALRQTYKSPKAQAEEMEQFVEAGVDYAKYLNEELGLTAEQIKNIGDQAISGRTVAAAILRGMAKDERLSGAMEKLSENTRGMLQSIKDTAKFLGAGIFSEAFAGVKDQIKAVRDYLNDLLDAFNKGGVGGVFERMFPPHMQPVIRTIIGSLKSLWDSLTRIYQAVKPIIQAFGEAFLGALAAVLPIIAALARVLAGLTEWLLQNEELVKALAFAIAGLKIAAMASRWVVSLAIAIRSLSIASVVAKAVLMLRNAIISLTGSMVRNPIVAAIMLVVAALLSLALSSREAQKWLESLMARLAQLAGFDMGEILQPEDKEDYSKWLEEYNGSLGDVIDSVEDTGEAAEDSEKKVKKFIASFDEVFQVPDDLDEIGGNLDEIFDGIDDLPTDMPKIEPPEIPPLPDVDDILPDFPDQIMLPAFVWPEIPPFQWPPLPEFAWPTLPAFEWPALPKFEWPDIPVLEWPPIPVPEFPDIPIPEWPKIPDFQWPPIPVPKFPDIPVPQWPKIPDFQWPPIPVPEFPQIPVPQWPKVPDFQWPPIPVPQFPPIPVPQWPKIPDFHWPQIPAFHWPPIPTFVWPQIPEFHWPEIPSLAEIFEKHKLEVGLAIGAIILLIVTIFTGGLPEILAAAGLIITRVVSIFTRLGPGIMTVIRNIPGTISGLFSRLPGLLGPIVTNMGNAFRNLPTNIMNLIRNIPSSVSGLFNKLPSPVKTVVTNLGNAFMPLPSNIMRFINNIPGNVSNLFNKLPSPVKTVVTRVGETFKNLPSNIMTFINNIPSKVQSLFDRLPSPVRTVVDRIAGFFSGLPGRISNAISSIPGKVADIFSKAWGRVKEFFGNIKEGLGHLGINMDFGAITGFAHGGIIGRDSIVRVGEKGRREAIVPLDNATAMAPFADAVAERLGLAMNQAGQRPSSGDAGGGLPNVLYVGTLIADDRSLKELERRMRIIRAGEQSRGVKS